MAASVCVQELEHKWIYTGSSYKHSFKRPPVSQRQASAFWADKQNTDSHLQVTNQHIFLIVNNTSCSILLPHRSVCW